LVSEVTKRFPARAVRLYLIQPHYRSTVEYSDTAIAEAAAALTRIDNFVERAAELVGPAEAAVPEVFRTAMDDDLGTPAAVAVLHAAVRDGNSGLDALDRDRVRDRLAEVTGMLDVLGLNADSPYWTDSGTDERLRAVVDGLVAALLAQRTEARARRDFAAADAIRDELTRLGIEVSDTSAGPRWSLSGTGA
jgi:cysteinyl-tRNA synthetase